MFQACTFPASTLELAIQQGARGPPDFLTLFFPPYLIFLSPPSIYTLNGLIYSHDPWICISTPISSSNCQTCICNCPLDSSNPMSHRHLRLCGFYLIYLSPHFYISFYIPYYC